LLLKIENGCANKFIGGIIIGTAGGQTAFLFDGYMDG
jgi:hypothetical protein